MLPSRSSVITESGENLAVGLWVAVLASWYGCVVYGLLSCGTPSSSVPHVCQCIPGDSHGDYIELLPTVASGVCEASLPPCWLLFIDGWSWCLAGCQDIFRFANVLFSTEPLPTTTTLVTNGIFNLSFLLHLVTTS